MSKNCRHGPDLFLVVSSGDVDAVPSASLPAVVAVINDPAVDAVAAPDGAVLSLLDLQTRCLGGAASSEDGESRVGQFLARMAEATGTQPLPLCNLSKVRPAARETELLRFAGSAMGSVLDRQLRRAADLSRSLAALRQTHERMQGAFAQLEKFVFSNNLAQRTEAVSLLPGRDMSPLELRDGEIVRQRLPISSVGLSDVEFFIEGIEDAGDGSLYVTLQTNEDDVVRGRWKLRGHQIEAGPVRLALHTALETSAMTPSLDLQWAGPGTVRLSTSLYHPDERLRARIGERMDARILALRCWSYLPGSHAAIPASAHLSADTGASPPTSRLLDDAILSKVTDLTPESAHSRYIAEQEAILVHPLGRGVSAMQVATAVPAGTVQLVSRIRTQHENAPVIEYALGIAPSGQKRVIPAAFEPSYLVGMTPWVRLVPQQAGELHLPLPEALPSDHDLVLMTRLAEQPGDTSFGWSTFSRIRIALA